MLGRESFGDTALQGCFRGLDRVHPLHGGTPWDASRATTLVASTEVMEVATCNQRQGELSSQGKTS